MELKDYRDRLDRIDDKIAALFRERMETVREIAAYKKAHHIPVLAAGREEEILRRVAGIAGEELGKYTVALHKTLMELSRSYQADLMAEAGPLREETGGQDDGG